MLLSISGAASLSCATLCFPYILSKRFKSEVKLLFCSKLFFSLLAKLMCSADRHMGCAACMLRKQISFTWGVACIMDTRRWQRSQPIRAQQRYTWTAHAMRMADHTREAAPEISTHWHGPCGQSQNSRGKSCKRSAPLSYQSRRSRYVPRFAGMLQLRMKLRTAPCTGGGYSAFTRGEGGGGGGKSSKYCNAYMCEA